MYLTAINKTDAIDLTPPGQKDKGRLTVRWLLGEPEGAPNFEMRYFSLTGEISTDWHSHEWEHQVFVVAGKGKFKNSDQEVELQPGNALFVAPGEQHHFICSGERFDFICVVPKGTRVCMVDDR